MSDEAQEYINDMFRKRGYTLDFHSVLAAEDLAFLKTYNDLVGAAYVECKELDAKTKELLQIVALTVAKSSVEHIRKHVELAIRNGATKYEVLAALKIVLLTAGVPAFQIGFEAWRQSVATGYIGPSTQ